ncbi:MAG TPA: signal recognition particle receptor subunit alpha, partial [Polyangia bacterium]|nr:signal recognition particle receptor subunit alpha [Polyangia bacterium]
MPQTWILYVALAVVFIVALLVIWRLSKRRGAVESPADQQPLAKRPGHELVPGQPETPQAKAAPKTAPATGKALKEGLEKTRGGFVARIGSLIGRKQIDSALVDQLEEILFTADIGARTSQKLFEAVKASLSRNELKDADAVWAVIRKESEAILERAQAKGGTLDLARAKPFVLL